VQEAGSPSRLGRVLQVYPYTLAALEQAMTDARFRSHQGKPVVVTVVENRKSRVIRRYEGGRETWSASTAEIRGEHGNGPQG
jgi:hypothetical protein